MRIQLSTSRQLMTAACLLSLTLPSTLLGAESAWVAMGNETATVTPSSPPAAVASEMAPATPVVTDPLELLHLRLQSQSSPTQRLDVLMQYLLEHPADPNLDAVKSLYQQTLQQAEQREPAILAPMLTLLDNALPVSARLEAAKLLGQVQDPRVIPVLSYMAWDSEQELQVAVVEALGLFRNPTAEKRLKGILEALASKPVQVAAIRSLGAQGTESARDTLTEIFRNDKRAREVRSAAGETLERYFPGHLASLGEGNEVLDRRGRILLVPASVGFGAYALGVVGLYGKSAAALPIGIGAGGVLGGASSYLLTQKRELTLGQAATIVTGGSWGLWTGLTTGQLATYSKCSEYATGEVWSEAYYDCQSNKARTVALAGLVGESVGLAAATLTLPRHRLTFEDNIVMNLGGLAGISLASGLQRLREEETSPFLDVGRLAAGLTSLGLTTWVTPQLRFSRGDVGLTMQGALQGAWIGSFLPIVVRGSQVRERWQGGLRVGASLGMVAGAGLAQLTDFPVNTNLFMTTTSVFGYMFGYGMPLMFGSENVQAETAAMLTGGITGLMGGLMLRDRVQLNRGDVAMTSLGTGWGLLQGALLANYLSYKDFSFSGKEIVGMSMVGTSIGGVTGLAVANTLDLSPWEVLQLSSGGVWGVWYALWAGGLYRSFNRDATNAQLFMLTLVSSNVGLATSAILLSPLVKMHPTRMGWTNLGGMTGAALFSLGAALFADSPEFISVSALTGTSFGLAAGAYISNRIALKEAPQHAYRLHRSLSALERWQPTVSLLPYTGEGSDGKPSQGWMVSLSAQQPLPH